MKKISVHYVAIVLTAILMLSGFLFAQSSTDSQSLGAFERLIDGKWQSEEGYQVFEWGVGKRSIKAKNFSVKNGQTKLLSEGTWFYHPGEKKIKGYITAVDMPVAFFDYTARIQDDQIISDLKSYSSTGERKDYEEVWFFTGKNSFTWTLYNVTPFGRDKVMGGKYTRQ